MEASRFQGHIFHVDSTKSGEMRTPAQFTGAKVDAFIKTRGGVLHALANIGKWISIAIEKAMNRIAGGLFARTHKMRLLSTMTNTMKPGVYGEDDQFAVDQHSSFGQQLMKGKAAQLDPSRVITVSSSNRKNEKKVEEGAPENVVTLSDRGQCLGATAGAIHLYHTSKKGEGIKEIQNAFSWGVPFTACLIQSIYIRMIQLHNTQRESSKGSASDSYITNAIFDPLDMKVENMITSRRDKTTFSKTLVESPEEKADLGTLIDRLKSGTYAVTLPAEGNNAHEISVIIEDQDRYIIDHNTGIYKLNKDQSLAGALNSIAEEYNEQGLNAPDFFIDKIEPQLKKRSVAQ